ncbi:uncharacterized protein LOC121729050 [Aricia agestis]|uniref:uncharacterized protein LOC121729050 n=1 Tax=Aricia agestis TaxID=91739 RepID=UPI001C2065AE|nr:uncharacterized protein LOC121729050 [Aricia agestis]
MAMYYLDVGGIIMKSSHNLVFLISLIVMKASSHELTRTKFASHVSVNTPASSFTHGVGNPVSDDRRNHRPSFRGTRRPQRGHSIGYARQKPAIPFQVEEFPRQNTIPWQYNNYMEYNIPVLPPSPYKVDSPDPESLWPNGLFLPPIPPHLGPNFRRSDNNLNGDTDNDPYLIEGTEAIAAVSKSRRHGMLYFHDIPHIESLLKNQELRIDNNLKPHRIGSIRHTWPYYRT